MAAASKSKTSAKKKKGGEMPGRTSKRKRARVLNLLALAHIPACAQFAHPSSAVPSTCRAGSLETRCST
eukprot:10280028-Lingulodinium_polyedra.AAC.1